MSRIGKLLIKIPTGVEIDFTANTLSVKGKYGTLVKEIPSTLNILINENKTLSVQPKNDLRKTKQLYGLFRSLIKNMVDGVEKQFIKYLELKGIGFKARIEDNYLILKIGFSHEVKLITPEGILVNVENNTLIKIQGINKELIGLFAEKIRSKRPPEAYKEKGIFYKGEIVKTKEGKSSK